MDDTKYMQMALEQALLAAAQGEVPVGAVVVYRPGEEELNAEPALQERVIARAGNNKESSCDPAGHAEFLALRQAAKALGRWRLSGCTVYVTLEPCVMCAGLMQQARIDRCVWGAADPKGGALGSLYRLNADERLNHRFDVSGGVLEKECAALLKSFFAQKRSERRTEHKSDAG